MSGQSEPVYDITKGDHSVNENINEEFTIDEIRLIIRKIKNGKTCGIDQIKNEVLKACPHELMVIMLKFFNAILNSGIVPELWCIGLIMHLYKIKGSQFDPDNNRGITLLSCMGKVFTALINYRLTKYLDAVGRLVMNRLDLDMIIRRLITYSHYMQSLICI